MIDVSWDGSNEAEYMADLQIITYDRKDAIAEVGAMLIKKNIYYCSFFARSNKNNTATVRVKVEIQDMEQLHRVIKMLKNGQGIIEVHRMGV